MNEGPLIEYGGPNPSIPSYFKPVWLVMIKKLKLLEYVVVAAN